MRAGVAEMMNKCRNRSGNDRPSIDPIGFGTLMANQLSDALDYVATGQARTYYLWIPRT